jgi:copper homeostasis protein
MLLEVAVFNVASALAASQAGADRLELCDNNYEGGTTASFGTLLYVKKQIQIPVFPIIRPRGGDFCYSNDEFEAMKKDVLLCKTLGFEGVVLGILNADGTIDEHRTSTLVNIAYPLEVTFHRAFDRTIEPSQALENIIETGCTRILTSGQMPNAIDGLLTIKQLIEAAKNRIIIMPGSGIRSNNIQEIAEFTGAEEFHSSAKKMIINDNVFNKRSMQEKNENLSVDEAAIEAMKKTLQQIA